MEVASVTAAEEKPTYIPGKQRAKTKGGKKGAPLTFKKKLQLNMPAEEESEVVP